MNNEKIIIAKNTPKIPNFKILKSLLEKISIRLNMVKTIIPYEAGVCFERKLNSKIDGINIKNLYFLSFIAIEKK